MADTGGKKSCWSAWLAWGCIVLAVFLFYGTRWFFGRLMLPNDFYIHYAWGTFFANRLAAGCLAPVWLPEVFRGLGAAVFLYYPPLYFYGTGLLGLLVDDMWLSMKLLEIATVSGLAWLAVRHARKSRGAGWMDGILAACAVACSPMLLARLFMLGGLPAFVSCFFMAAAAIRAANVILRDKRGWDWQLTFWIGLLSWTHNLVVLMALAAIFGGLLGLAVFRRRAPILTIAGSCLLGFLLGFPRYLAAFADMPSINHGNIVSLEELSWQNNFVLPFGLKTTWGLFQWGIGGVLAFGVLLWGIVLLAKRPALSNTHVFWLGGTLTCLFFALPLSWFLWKWLPPLHYFQTPTRFLDPLALFAAVGLLGAVREAKTPRLAWVLRLPLLLSLALGVAVVGRVWQLGVPAEPHLSSWLRDTANQWEYLPAGQPRGWRGLPEIRPGEIAHLPDGDVAVLKPARDGGLVAELRQDAPAPRLLPVFHHARWTVCVDGREIPFRKHGETGLIEITAPAGRHRVETKWKRGFWFHLSYGGLLFLVLCVPLAGIWHDRRTRMC